MQGPLYYELGGQLAHEGELIKKCAEVTSTVWIGQFNTGHTVLVQSLTIPTSIKGTWQAQVHELKKVMQEIKKLEALKNPSLIDLTDFAFVPNPPGEPRLDVLIFESTHTSLDKIKRLGEITFPEGTVCSILKGLLTTLASLHSQQISWLDLRAKNIYINSTGHVLINPISLHSITRHVTKESIPFMSPEEIQACLSGTSAPPWSFNATPELVKSDIWSFGITAIDLALDVKKIDLFSPLFEALNEHTIRSFYDGITTVSTPQLFSDSGLGAQFCEMVSSCLCTNILKRPSAEELLRHPLFQNVSSDLDTSGFDFSTPATEEVGFLIKERPDSTEFYPGGDTPNESPVQTAGLDYATLDSQPSDASRGGLVRSSDHNQKLDGTKFREEHPEFLESTDPQQHSLLGPLVPGVATAGSRSQTGAGDHDLRQASSLQESDENSSEQEKLKLQFDSNPQHPSLEHASASLMKQMLTESKLGPDSEMRKHQSPRSPRGTKNILLPPSRDDGDSTPPGSEDPANSDNDSCVEDDLPTLNISIMDSYNTNLPVMVHIGYKSDCFLIFLRSIAGTTIDIQLNIQQIIIKGTLPALKVPGDVQFKGPVGGQFGAVIDFCDNIDVTRVTRKIANQTLIVTLPKAIPSLLGTQVF